MFFCLWIPQFAAWALEQSQPQLARRPFAVCEKGKVVAVSPLAQEAGVRVGMTSGRAHSRLASLLILQRDPSCEALAWGEVQNALYGLTPQIEPIFPGLLFAEVEAKKTLALLKCWRAYGGQGGDRATAQLAALFAAFSGESGDVLCIRDKREAPFADRVPLEAVLPLGISPKSLERLKWFGWKSVGALRILSRRQLEEQIGADGLTLFHLAQASRAKENGRPVASWTPPEELWAKVSFEFPAREPNEWDGALNQILDQVCQEMGSRSARTLEVRIETPIAPLAARRVLKEPISQARLLGAPARAALAEALEMLAPLPPVVLGIEVRLSTLSTPALQGSLFEGDKAEKTERPSRISAALKGLESRFAGKTGTYVPDQPYSPFPEEAWMWMPALEAVHFQNSNTSKDTTPKTNELRTNEPKPNELKTIAPRSPAPRKRGAL